MHFLCIEPPETDKNVLKFTKNLVLKFHWEPCECRITMILCLLKVDFRCFIVMNYFKIYLTFYYIMTLLLHCHIFAGV